VTVCRICHGDGIVKDPGGDGTYPTKPCPGCQRRSDLLTVREVAALFRVDPRSVNAWALDGRLSSIKTPGGYRRFHESEVLALLEAGTTHATVKEAEMPESTIPPSAITPPGGGVSGQLYQMEMRGLAERLNRIGRFTLAPLYAYLEKAEALGPALRGSARGGADNLADQRDLLDAANAVQVALNCIAVRRQRREAKA
jgi:excisionase family DNA binding protein